MEERERELESKRYPVTPGTSKETSGGDIQTDKDDIESTLDISSDKFDPMRALYSPKVPLPYPNIKCFNNIAEYESFMKGGRGRAKPENVEKRLRKAQKGKADPERIERLKRLMVNNPVAEDEEGMHTGSPLGELNRCVQHKLRVKVHIRTFKGLRGVCSGFVVAFDKFWNLLFEKLKVQESALERKGDKHPGHFSSQLWERSREDKSSLKGKNASKSSQKSENKPKVEYGRVHTRHVNQLFIRGENVLLVNITQD
ncbi:hypothetical protein DNTS_014994 [Danionella cerebrum]|uniref:LSM domain-containing protein n=1 Tax=Danionella cerebrum TaxID=2873325 RepID=A0A553QFQ7_9TELE|nr:hypothetical protein DNTS_014994 [Danionella translucida]